jgi:hypothetical protein
MRNPAGSTVAKSSAPILSNAGRSAPVKSGRGTVLGNENIPDREEKTKLGRKLQRNPAPRFNPPGDGVPDFGCIVAPQ